MAHESYETFDQVKVRLDEIVSAVGAKDMPLEDALSLYEEAVGLGLRASELLEENIEASNDEADLDELQNEACLQDETQGGAEVEAAAAESDAEAPTLATA